MGIRRWSKSLPDDEIEMKLGGESEDLPFASPSLFKLQPAQLFANSDKTTGLEQ